MPAVIAIFGPTASGKSDVAVALAERIEAELVSSDAMQVYRGLPVLTNQSPHPTRLVGMWELGHDASVAEYAELAHAAIDEILSAGKTPVVVGGSGLYLRAALGELALPPSPTPARRRHWQQLYDRVGAKAAHELLSRLDPEAAAFVHANDRRRIVRALELVELGASLKPKRSRLWSGDFRHPTFVIGLEMPKDVLEQRIVTRTRAMFTANVESEVREALKGSVSRTARAIHGFREVAELPSEQALEALIVATRRYAAYQRKWMRRLPGLVSVNADRPPEDIADEIVEVARARQRLPARRAG